MVLVTRLSPFSLLRKYIFGVFPFKIAENAFFPCFHHIGPFYLHIFFNETMQCNQIKHVNSESVVGLHVWAGLVDLLNFWFVAFGSLLNQNFWTSDIKPIFTIWINSMYAISVNTTWEFLICCQSKKRIRNEKVIHFWLFIHFPFVHFEENYGSQHTRIWLVYLPIFWVCPESIA